MFTFEHLVIMEPSNVSSKMMETLKKTAKQITAYDTVPKDDAEILKRIQDADGILISYTSSISREVLENCPKLHYIGLCCSLYSPESANVDMQAAKELGVTVTGVREYGDNGVVEFVLYEIIGLFHGYANHIFESYAKEMTGVKMGIIGLGDTGRKIAHRSEEHTSELQSPYVNSYAFFCLKKKNRKSVVWDGIIGVVGVCI